MSILMSSVQLVALSMAIEVNIIRFKSNQKRKLRQINQATEIKHKIHVDIALVAHKVSLLIQVIIGRINTRDSTDGANGACDLEHDKEFIQRTLPRVLRCMVECMVHKGSAVAVKEVLELSRSFAAKAWENSPAELLQIKGIGQVYTKKLASHNCRSVNDLRTLSNDQIERYLSRNPPFGADMKTAINALPMFDITLSQDRQIVSTVHAAVAACWED